MNNAVDVSFNRGRRFSFKIGPARFQAGQFCCSQAMGSLVNNHIVFYKGQIDSFRLLF